MEPISVQPHHVLVVPLDNILFVLAQVVVQVQIVLHLIVIQIMLLTNAPLQLVVMELAHSQFPIVMGILVHQPLIVFLDSVIVEQVFVLHIQHAIMLVAVH
jgi:hypothetical protein